MKKLHILLLCTLFFPFNVAFAQLPACQSPLADTDGDGFGWESIDSVFQSCIAQSGPVAELPACIDDDGDGWGWTGTESCFVQPRDFDYTCGGDLNVNLTLTNLQNGEGRLLFSGNNTAFTYRTAPPPSSDILVFQNDALILTLESYTLGVRGPGIRPLLVSVTGAPGGSGERPFVCVRD